MTSLLCSINSPSLLFSLLVFFQIVRDIRRTAGGAILDPADKIKDVLDDNDFVSIGEEGREDTNSNSPSGTLYVLYILLPSSAGV